MKIKKKVLEELSDLEHAQWMSWAKDIAKTEKITPERLKRWKEDMFIPYSELSEEDKDKDREIAMMVLRLILKHYELTPKESPVGESISGGLGTMRKEWP